ncbi:SPOR domain-containing protein [Candidatus Ferrigenium straubiae]|jgi:cell division protein FtsN|uniref:SPOR domain-containing protein n=1 Tax=Candidatus Ferrigenium straubiae TaxID=2919506 RepID=UPI003F4AD0C9
MSRNTGNKSSAPRKSGSSLLTGILIGMVIGVGMAAGLAWYIMKSPSPFVQKEQVAAKPPVDVSKPAAPAVTAAPAAQPAASGVAEGKPRFEFYKVLTDKQDATVAVPAKPADKLQAAKPQSAESKPTDSKPATAASEPYFLQAGSFSNADDAEKLKARLALLGIEASTQTATIPDKGVWHRVRLGPYKNADEMSKARTLLKQNGVDATPMRAQ